MQVTVLIGVIDRLAVQTGQRGGDSVGPFEITHGLNFHADAFALVLG